MRTMKMQWISKLMALALVFAGSVGTAVAAETPTSLAGATVVTADQAKKLADGGAAVIDTRVANEYVQEHIKGAKSVVYKEKSPKDVKFDPKEVSFDMAKLPADRNVPVVFYCNGAECWKSYKASKLAIDAGHKKVNWLRGGIPEWKAKGHPIQ